MMFEWFANANNVPKNQTIFFQVSHGVEAIQNSYKHYYRHVFLSSFLKLSLVIFLVTPDNGQNWL
jgi:hypothetical protein